MIEVDVDFSIDNLELGLFVLFGDKLEWFFKMINLDYEESLMCFVW